MSARRGPPCSRSLLATHALAAAQCRVTTEVLGVDAAAGRPAVCVDGDPRCDGDGNLDGACTFQVRVCLAPGAATSCWSAAAARPLPESLAAALDALRSSPSTEPLTSCSAIASVPVRTHRRRRGRVTLTVDVPPAPRARLALVCRPERALRRATLAAIQRLVFDPTCADATCHGAARAGGLSLAPGEAYASLVSVPPTNAAARTAGLLRVVPGEPGQSLLLVKLAGLLAGQVGDRMPTGEVGATFPPPPLGRAAIDLVRRWILAGAPADPAPQVLHHATP